MVVHIKPLVFQAKLVYEFNENPDLPLKTGVLQGITWSSPVVECKLIMWAL